MKAKPFVAGCSFLLLSVIVAIDSPAAADNLQFESSFENKKQAIETVTPMREKDGKWKVSGYFIK